MPTTRPDSAVERALGAVRGETDRLPGAFAAATLAATSIVIGILWDISWHRSIGRDTFWTPAHLAIYLGGALAGLSAAALVWKATFGDDRARGASVGVGPLRGPLGAWVMAWGAAAMIASAPFDDWWHDAYGLDVTVISPPHAVLAVGMVAVALGAMLLALSRQNAPADRDVRSRAALYLYASGLLVTLAATFLIEYTSRSISTGGSFTPSPASCFPCFSWGSQGLAGPDGRPPPPRLFIWRCWAESTGSSLFSPPRPASRPSTTRSPAWCRSVFRCCSRFPRWRSTLF